MNPKEHSPSTPAERSIWNYLNGHAAVTHNDMRRHCEATNWQRSNYISKLLRLGVLHTLPPKDGCKVFTILDLDGAQAYAHSRRNTPQGAMWTVMRSLQKFTPADITLALRGSKNGPNEQAILTYCQQLALAEYLKVLERAKPGVRPARYQLIQNTGPLPPRMRNLQVLVDGNTDRAVWAQGARI